MKKILTVIISLAILLPCIAGACALPASGATDTVSIRTAEELAAFFGQITTANAFEGKTIKLEDEITFESGATLPVATGTFAGTFDGQGHTISGIKWTGTTNGKGIFGSASGTATLKNFTITSSEFNTDKWQPGALIGTNSATLTIDRVHVTSTVYYNATKNENGATYQNGFYVGLNQGPLTITNCVFAGEMTSKGGEMGAFVGCNEKAVTIKNCANYGKLTSSISTSKRCAGLIGKCDTSDICTFSDIILDTRNITAVNQTVDYIISTNESTGVMNASNILVLKNTGVTRGDSVGTVKEITDASLLKGTAAQSSLDEAGITGFVASAVGYPVPRNTAVQTSVANAKTLYKGYQLRENSNGTVDIRLVGVANIEKDDLASYDSVGFTFVGYFASPEVSSTVNIHSEGKTTVYTSILSAGQEWSAKPETGAQFIFVQEITGVPNDCGDLMLEISTFYEKNTKTMEGTEMIKIQMNGTPAQIPTPVGTALYTSAQPLRTGESMAYTVTPAAYTNYINELEGSFGTAVQSANISGNSFATYIRGSKQINISYYPRSGKLTVIETAKGYVPSADGALASGSITQMALDGIGMSYVTKMADGKFIIIDGGLNEGSNKTNLWNYLDENTTGDAKPQITWIFTHTHPDHVALATSFINEYGSQITIDAVGHNFGTAEDGIAGGEAMLSAVAVNAPSAKVWIMHAGQVANIYGCKVTVLSTHEEICVDGKAIGGANAASSAFMLELENGKMLILGDITGRGAANLVENFDASALKADTLQAAHHGADAADGTYGGSTYDKILAQLYAMVAPEKVAVSNTVEELSNNASYATYGVYGSSGYGGATEIFETETQKVLG